MRTPPREELPPPVRAYLERSVYPPDSGRLDLSGDALESNPRYERFKRVPGSHGSEPDIEFLWTADAFRYASDEQVTARFEARQGEAPALVRQLEGWAQAEGRSASAGERVALTFRSDGTARVASLDLSEHFAEHHGFVVLGARYTVADVIQQTEEIRIFVTPALGIPAAFTGNFRDEVRDGSLWVETGIEVYEPGFYRIDAHLHGPAGEPIGWTSFKGDLGRSDGVVPLRFFGRVIRDVGIAGPYEVRALRGYRFRDGEFPDRVNLRDYEGVHRTRDHRLSAFSDDEWDDAHRRQMVELLLEDHAAGISIDVPSPIEAP